MFYEFSNPPIYLDLGGALAAFGLIFAVYQLRKPKWELVLRIRSQWQGNLFWIFGGIGLLLVLARVLLPQEWLWCFPIPFNNPLAYEVAAYLFFVASPVSLLYFSTKSRGLFNKETARRFYEALVWEISKTSDDNVNAALDVLLANFEDICKAIKEYSTKEDIRQSASATLDVILSDASVVKVLTTKRLDALQYIFGKIEKHNIHQREAGVGIPSIVRNLFNDKESFFYKHLNREGLALPLNIYESIFDTPVILNNFNLFGYPTLWHSMPKELSNVGLNVFIEALSRSIKTYLKTGAVSPRYINDGLSYLSETFGNICREISDIERKGGDTSYTSLQEQWWGLHTIAHFLGHGYTFLAYQDELNQKVKEKEKTVPEASFYSDTTINAGIAAALYKAFEQLSYIENTLDSYHTILDLLYGMMHEYEYKEGYRPPFEKRMWEQIAANVVHRHYPAALRTYLEFIGFCAASDENQRQGWIGEQAERMRRLLYIDLKPLLDADTKMVNDEKMKDALLPKSMSYENGNFTYTFGFGKGEKKIIQPPPEGSTSALAGVDLEHRSLL
jgi:hypothetical protein